MTPDAPIARLRYTLDVPSLIEAIEIKRKTFFEYENAPYVCLDFEVSRPTARGGQTLVRLKMRNLLTRAVFDKTFKAGEKFGEPDLVQVAATFLYSDGDGYHFMDQDELRDADVRRRHRRRRSRAARRQPRRADPQVQRQPDRHPVPATRGADGDQTEPGVRGDTASGGVTKAATLETGLEIRVPLFIKEGEKVKVHTETREFAGRA